MIPKTDSFSLRTTVKDAYGKITEVSENTYYGIIERQVQFRSKNDSTTWVGEGIIFTEEIQAVDKLGLEVVVDGNVYTISQAFDAKDLTGSYHHTEILYA